jgi:hypothetical protein
MLVLSINVLAKVHKLLYKTEPQNSQGLLVCDINYVCYAIRIWNFHFTFVAKFSTHLLEFAIIYDYTAVYHLSIEKFYNSSEIVNLVHVHVVICQVFLCL